MKHLILRIGVIVAAVVATALFATSARSAGFYPGINLSWDDCGTNGIQVRNFACDTNSGLHTMIGSFVAPEGVEAMSANEVIMDLDSETPEMPAWWQMRTGLCRAGSLSGNFDFTDGYPSCYDYWQGGAIGSFAMDPPVGNRVRIKGVFALPTGDPRITSIDYGAEVYSFKLRVNNAKTIGPAACGGCEMGACIVLNQIKLAQPVPRPSITLNSPADRLFVSWQCPAHPFYYDHSRYYCLFPSCPTPARAHTWGQIKQLYR